MKLKIIYVTCLIMLSLPVIAQKTITDKWPNGQIAEQYTINANGDRHGTYKRWNRQGRLIHESNWVNGKRHGKDIDYDSRTGAIQRDATYYHEQITSLKVYKYNAEGTKRSLITEGTWHKDGTPITYREFVYVDGKDQWYEHSGQLPNGRWWLNAGYNEKYNGNDTIYVWQDRTKTKYIGKTFVDSYLKVRSNSDWLEHYTYDADQLWSIERYTDGKLISETRYATIYGQTLPIKSEVDGHIKIPGTDKQLTSLKLRTFADNDTVYAYEYTPSISGYRLAAKVLGDAWVQYYTYTVGNSRRIDKITIYTQDKEPEVTEFVYLDEVPYAILHKLHQDIQLSDGTTLHNCYIEIYAGIDHAYVWRSSDKGMHDFVGTTEINIIHDDE